MPPKTLFVLDLPKGYQLILNVCVSNEKIIIEQGVQQTIGYFDISTMRMVVDKKALTTDFLNKLHDQIKMKWEL